MGDYIFFDEALHMFVNAFLASVVVLMATSGIGLAIVETIEKPDSRHPSKNFR